MTSVTFTALDQPGSSTLISRSQTVASTSHRLPSLTRASLSSLEPSLNQLSFSSLPLAYIARNDRAPSPCQPIRASSRSTPLPCLATDPWVARPPSPGPSPTVRRKSWADARSCRLEARRILEAESETTSSGEESDSEPNFKIHSFPPRRPSPHPLHRRVRSDPGPSTSSANKRDLRRTLLKRRATLTQKSSFPTTTPRSPLPARSRGSIETAQALRLKTFNFPSVSTSPFLSVDSHSPSPAPSSISSFSYSSNSVGSRFSDDSSSEDSASSGSETSDSEEDEEDDRDGFKSNAFDLSLDLFPAPPSPTF